MLQDTQLISPGKSLCQRSLSFIH